MTKGEFKRQFRRTITQFSCLRLFLTQFPLPTLLFRTGLASKLLTSYLNKLMHWPVCREKNAEGWGGWRGGGGGRLYQFHTVGSRENLIPFHPSLSRCHSPPQVVIALTASSRFLEEKSHKAQQ